MSDYLTNLAVRALRPQNMVRPKLPSRYERTPPGPATTNPEDLFFQNSPLIEQESESFDASSFSQEPSVSDASVDAQLDRPGNLKLATPGPADVRSAQPARSRSSDNRVRFGRFHTDSTLEESETFAQPDAPAPQQQRVEQEHPDFHQRNAPPKVLNPGEAVSERVVRSKHRLTSPAMESFFELEGFTSTDAVTAETEAAGESTSTFDQKSTQEVTSIKVRPAIIASKIVDSRYSPVRESDPQPGSQAETTVNVSIGRVEVRAVQAQATQPRSARDSVGSAMTLDEYLEGRRGGGQR